MICLTETMVMAITETEIIMKMVSKEIAVGTMTTSARIRLS